MAKKTPLKVPARGLAPAARDILRFLAKHKVSACLIGGLAVQRWGEPRVTQDVDLTVLAPFGEEAAVSDVLLSAYAARDAKARDFALQYRAPKLRAPGGVPIDVSLGALPFEIEVLARASPWRLSPRIELLVCSPEDLIVYKLVAGRPRDLLDVEGVVRLRWRDLDLRRVRSRTRQFAELFEVPHLLHPFEDALRTIRRASSR